jgi:3-hydroxyisobutyrate dehydrogenase-like beta-hydroxyacid dehydrogenase
MTAQNIKIAFIGLGKMGSVLAKRLLDAGYDLTVYNRTQSKMKTLVDAGACAAHTVQDAVKDKTFIITSLFDDKSVNDVVCGEDGMLTACKKGAIHIGTTTILPATSKTLVESHDKAGIIYVAGNVLGIPKLAEKGELTTLAAGNAEALKKCKDIFKTYSAKIINAGPAPYQANVMKLCVNYMLAAIIEIMGEIYTFGEKNKMDNDILRNFFENIFAHPSFKLYVNKVKERSFDDVNFELSGGSKDMGLIQQAFADTLVVPGIANVIKNNFISAAANGMKDKDWSAITEVIRMQAGLKE